RGGSMPAVRLVAIALAATLLPATASAKWTRLRTPDFVFIGDAPEGAIRQVAQKLEQFRDVLALVVPGGRVVSPEPTVVIVFRDNQSFTPYKPKFQGRAIQLAGLFANGGDVNYIAINAEAAGDALHVVFHEYTHYLTRNVVGELPVWANEGLA